MERCLLQNGGHNGANCMPGGYTRETQGAVRAGDASDQHKEHIQ